MDRPSSSDSGYQTSNLKKHATYSVDNIEMATQDLEAGHQSTRGRPPRSTRYSVRNLMAGLLARAPRLKARVLARATQLKADLNFFGISLVYNFLLCWFIIVVLIHGHVETPLGVFWGFSTTNLMVTILSQISAYLTDTILRSYMAVLRRVFLVKPNGISFASYVGLGEASGWFTVFQVSAMNWFLNFYCNFRLSLFVLALAFGAILKFMAAPSYYFRASNATMPVYAGLIPLNVHVMERVTPADMAMFFNMMSADLLSNSNYAKEYPLAGCAGDCRSFIMPGGLQMARQAKQQLNESVLSGGMFLNAETVTFGTAPGFVLRYDKPDANLTFDLLVDCVYGGQQVNNGLQVCIKQSDESILVGWAACPKALLDSNMCNTNTTWRSEPMTSTVLLTAYKQFTSPSYNRRNGSIVNIQIPEGSTPQLVYTNATDYKSVFNAILVPTATATINDVSNINALINEVTWSHRTWAKSFPDDKDTTTTFLRNVLAVPFQHTVTATLFGNYSLAERGLNSTSDFNFTLPEEMLTTATGGISSSKLTIRAWTGDLFIAGVATVHILVGAGMLWVLCREEALPDAIGLGDIEVARAAARTEIVAVKPKFSLPVWFVKTPSGLDGLDDGGNMRLLEAAEREDVGGGKRNTWQLARMLRGVRVKSVKPEHADRDVEAQVQAV